MDRDAEEIQLELRIARAKAQLKQIETEEQLAIMMKKLWQSRLMNLRSRLKSVREQGDLVDLMGKKEE